MIENQPNRFITAAQTATGARNLGIHDEIVGATNYKCETKRYLHRHRKTCCRCQILSPDHKPKEIENLLIIYILKQVP